jgi:hypothetical protein
LPAPPSPSIGDGEPSVIPPPPPEPPVFPDAKVKFAVFKYEPPAPPPVLVIVSNIELPPLPAFTILENGAEPEPADPPAPTVIV